VNQIGVNIIRVIFALISLLVGYFVGANVVGNSLFGAILGLVLALLVILIELALAKHPPRKAIWGMIGLGVGILIGCGVAYILSFLPPLSRFSPYIFIFSNLIFGYLGLIVVLQEKGRLPWSSRMKSLGANSDLNILDTSVIIDGRIAEICETKFLGGTLIVPRFILREIQYVADSPDALKRARGRRGLEILRRIQEKNELKVVIEERDFPETQDVDTKLVNLAKVLRAKIVTNDYNLNKVAELHGVEVLNVNDLANALKPVFLPGEEFKIRLMKRGKGATQGVGYLEDGTMVVVDEGSTRLGRTVEVVVTSMIQTSAGRMVFAKLKPKV